MGCHCFDHTEKKEKPLSSPADIGGGCQCAYSFVPCNCPQVIGRNTFVRRNKNTNKRIAVLANPKNRGRKHQPKACERFKKSIEIVRPFKISTRLEQLSLRPVRHLMSNREAYQSFMSKLWDCRFSVNIKKSSATVYSKLYGLELPRPPKPIHKWTANDWKIHTKWLASRAMPKKIFKPEKRPHEWRDLNKLMPRVKKLSQPVRRHVRPKFNGKAENTIDVPITKVKQSAQEYCCSDKICELSTTLERNFTPKYTPEEIRSRFVSGRQKLTTTERTLQLAQPKKDFTEGPKYKDNPWGVMPNALHAVASERVEELAKPKNR